ncbi:hypothetical protein [Propionivibrio sp.]|uniref:hypothetical protein n=1 Tax=Propionivibrio sp. TaxID=2212460 RepID=UPI003BF1337D
MDWFERLTGFRENAYDETCRQLEVEGNQLHSLVNGKSYGIGELELVSLQTLRERVNSGGGLPGRLKVSVVTGDVRKLHQSPEYNGALFQVASQFNLLEMVSPTVTPEQGVTRYQHDSTQGPACAIAAGAATIYRNYFAPVAGGHGQTSERQFDGLADLGNILSQAVGLTVEALWSMSNGYALCTSDGLNAISEYLGALAPKEIDVLSGKLRIGVHSDVEVTDAQGPGRPHVSQVFCSALPIAYSSVSGAHWKAFASLILQAAYNATMLAAVLNAQRGASKIVLLTRLGGGAFGNDDDWIHAAMRRALQTVEGFDLDVKLVSYGSPSHAMLQMVEDFG